MGINNINKYYCERGVFMGTRIEGKYGEDNNSRQVDLSTAYKNFSKNYDLNFDYFFNQLTSSWKNHFNTYPFQVNTTLPEYSRFENKFNERIGLFKGCVMILADLSKEAATSPNLKDNYYKLRDFLKDMLYAEGKRYSGNAEELWKYADKSLDTAEQRMALINILGQFTHDDFFAMHIEIPLNFIIKMDQLIYGMAECGQNGPRFQEARKDLIALYQSNNYFLKNSELKPRLLEQEKKLDSMKIRFFGRNEMTDYINNIETLMKARASKQNRNLLSGNYFNQL